MCAGRELLIDNEFAAHVVDVEGLGLGSGDNDLAIACLDLGVSICLYRFNARGVNDAEPVGVDGQLGVLRRSGNEANLPLARLEGGLVGRHRVVRALHQGFVGIVLPTEREAGGLSPGVQADEGGGINHVVHVNILRELERTLRSDAPVHQVLLRGSIVHLHEMARSQLVAIYIEILHGLLVVRVVGDAGQLVV